jgi:Protein of unknown function (DUF1573)/Secretion system C-terminal sorting domain
MSKFFLALVLLVPFYSNLLQAQVRPEDTNSKFPTTKIVFKETEYIFGSLNQGEIVIHEYKFNNTGNEPLVILDARTSSGSTTCLWPKEPIAPGFSGVIKVKFDSKDKHGPQTKQISVISNTEPQLSILYIKGIVLLPNEGKRIEYDKDAELKQALERDEQIRFDRDAETKRREELNEKMKADSAALVKKYKELEVTLKEARKTSNRATPDSELEEPEMPDMAYSEISFDNTEFDFDTIVSGDIVEHIFRFTNTGKEPLFIVEVRGGACGCTIQNWSKDPIPIGGSGAIVVKYNSEGKQGTQVKAITVWSNTEAQKKFLFLKGEVIDLFTKKAKFGNRNAQLLPYQVTIAPNPISTKVRIAMKGADGLNTDIEIFNNSGKLVSNLFVQNWMGEVELPIAELSEGIYWLSIKVGTAERFNQSFIVVN